MIIDVAASEMFLLRMLCRRLDMLAVLGSFPMGEELCCEVESADFWVGVEGEGGPPMTVEALETTVVWAKEGQKAPLKMVLLDLLKAKCYQAERWKRIKITRTPAHEKGISKHCARIWSP